VVCNSGVGLTPVIDDKLHHYSAGGLYNGLVLLIDDETKTYWDHVTGEAVHGPLAESGAKMPMWGIEMTNVETALQREPDLPVCLSKPGLIGLLMGWFSCLIDGRLPPGFRKTMAPTDNRLPEMGIGLGVVTDETQRFYPMSAIRPELYDAIDGRAIHLSIGPDSVPSAIWTDDETRPTQLFSRWYGFSLTYPKCEVHRVIVGDK